MCARGAGVAREEVEDALALVLAAARREAPAEDDLLRRVVGLGRNTKPPPCSGARTDHP
jgi:hypothetical protein